MQQYVDGEYQIFSVTPNVSTNKTEDQRIIFDMENEHDNHLFDQTIAKVMKITKGCMEKSSFLGKQICFSITGEVRDTESLYITFAFGTEKDLVAQTEYINCTRGEAYTLFQERVDTSKSISDSLQEMEYKKDSDDEEFNAEFDYNYDNEFNDTSGDNESERKENYGSLLPVSVQSSLPSLPLQRFCTEHEIAGVAGDQETLKRILFHDRQLYYQLMTYNDPDTADEHKQDIVNHIHEVTLRNQMMIEYYRTCQRVWNVVKEHTLVTKLPKMCIIAFHPRFSQYVDQAISFVYNEQFFAFLETANRLLSKKIDHTTFSSWEKIHCYLSAEVQNEQMIAITLSCRDGEKKLLDYSSGLFSEQFFTLLTTWTDLGGYGDHVLKWTNNLPV